MKIIDIENLSYSYKIFERRPGFINGLKDLFNRKVSYEPAIKSISLQISQGELIGVLGENGAGKTTFMKLLSGILTPKSGELSVLDSSPKDRQKSFLSQLGVMFGQKSQLIWDLPAIDTLNVLKVVYKIDKEQFDKDLEFYLKELNLEDKLYVPVRKLSLGQRIKFNLIASVIHRPKLLLLDEPTIGVDVLSQSNIYSFLKTLNQKYGTTILLSSHNSKDILALARRVIFLKEGELLYDGPLHAFRLSNERSYSYFVGTIEDRLPKGFDTDSMTFERLNPASFKIKVKDPKDLSKLDFSEILSLQESEADLDEILKALYAEKV